MYDQAIGLYDSGELAKAQELLAKVDQSAAGLGWAKNRKVKSLLEAIPGEIEAAKARKAEEQRLAAAASADAQARLKASRELLAAQKLSEARDSAEAVAKIEHLADDDLRQQAAALLAEINQKEAAANEAAAKLNAEMAQLYDQAIGLYDSGELAKAQELLAKVDQSAAGLGWAKNRKVKSLLEAIPGEIEAAKARKAEEQRLAAAASADAQARLKASRELLAAQRFDQARANANAVLEAKALTDGELRADASKLLEAIAAAEAKAAQLAQERASKAEAAYRKASAFYKAEDYVRAKAALQEASAMRDALASRQQSVLESRLSDIDDRIAEQRRLETKRRELALARERAAASLYMKAQTAIKAERYRQARELLVQLKGEYADTEFVRRH